jgi:hypothetical protein
LEAVKHNAKVLRFIPDRLKAAEICLEAIKKDCSMLKFVPEKTEHKKYYMK